MRHSVAALVVLVSAPPAVADIVTVTSFGASPTATAAANAAAFQAAINALPSPRGGTVLIPASTYQLSTGLFWDRGAL